MFSQNRMGTWLRVGRRFEYTILAICVAWFLGMAFILLPGAPAGITVRAILWVAVGLPPLVVVVLAFEFCPSLRRYAERKARARWQPAKLASRLRVYFLVSAVVIFASVRIGGSLLERKIASAASILHFFYVDMAILVLFIVSNELKIWRSSRHAPRE